MYALKRTHKLKVISISVAGGVSHNIGQLIVAAFVVETYNIFYYMPVLIFAGALTGFLIGILGQEFIFRFQKVFREHEMSEERD